MKITAALMLKAPRPGTVKTRLASDLGAEPATAIYRNLAEHQLQQIPHEWACTIHYAPAEAEAEMRNWLEPVAPPGTLFAGQCPGDLGERLIHAVCIELDRGAEAVVLLGGDCPDLRKEELLQVSEYLSNSDIVISPATDGGYVLLALKKTHPDLFRGISWSSSRVLEETLQKAVVLRLQVYLTEYFTDIDDYESLRKYKDHWLLS